MSSTSESLLSQEISKSVDQICTQLSVTNVAVPKIDQFKNILDFIAEFEMMTSMLPEHQMVKLVMKAFPTGRYSAWFERTLKPIINTSSWENIKSLIIERYSDTQPKERHLKKVQNLKFNPNGELKLYDFIEDMLFSLSKVFTKENDETKISYVKSLLPQSILPTLTSIPGYSTAVTVNDFMKACRQYDINNGDCKASTSSSDKVQVNELVTLIKDLVKQSSSTNTAAAIAPARNELSNRTQTRETANQPVEPHNYSYGQSNYHRYPIRPPSPYSGRRDQRSPSPGRQSVEQNSQNPYQQQQYHERNYNRYKYGNPSTRFSHDNYQRGGRSPSPRGFTQGQNYMNNNENNNNYAAPRSAVRNASQRDDIYNNEAYFKRFGVPPYPCSTCQLMHWSRHCPDHLN